MWVPAWPHQLLDYGYNERASDTGSELRAAFCDRRFPGAPSGLTVAVPARLDGQNADRYQNGSARKIRVVETGIDALVQAGDEALRVGDWAAAERCYRSVLESAEAGEALFGLGIARWWSGDTDEALRFWERAYAVSRRQSDPGQAVFSAVYLCLAFRMSLGNDAAA